MKNGLTRRGTSPRRRSRESLALRWRFRSGSTLKSPPPWRHFSFCRKKISIGIRGTRRTTTGQQQQQQQQKQNKGKRDNKMVETGPSRTGWASDSFVSHLDAHKKNSKKEEGILLVSRESLESVESLHSRPSVETRVLSSSLPWT